MKPRARGRAPHRLRVGFFGVLGSGNLGNDASLDVVVRHLRQQHPDIEIGFLAMGPEELTRRYGAPSTPLQWYEAHRDALHWAPDLVLKVVGRLLDPARTLRWVRGYDVVVVPGMGVLESTTPVRPWGLPFGLLSLAVASRLAGTSLALLCVGVEGHTGRVVRWMFRASAELADYRSYRDQLSHSAMRDLGVDVSRDKVFPDLVLGRPTLSPHRIRGLVGVGLMNFRGRIEDRPRAAELHEQYVARITEIVQRLVTEGWQVRLLVGDVEDIPVARRVQAAAMGTPPSAGAQVDLANTATLDELLDQLAEAQVVVGTRYHTVLAALTLGIPTISIGYARKNDVLMELFGLGAFCQTARAVDVDRTLEQFHDLVTRQDEVSRMIERRLPGIRRDVERQLAALSTYVLARDREVAVHAQGPGGSLRPSRAIRIRSTDPHVSAREKGAQS